MTQTREERKGQTRRAILDAALRMASEQSLVAVSLRQITKEVGVVPTAFYRHFDSVEQLGLVLVDEALESLRTLLNEVRSPERDLSVMISGSVDVLAEHVLANPAHFAFIARERSAGPEQVRVAIRRGIRFFERELAHDLGQLPRGTRPAESDLPIVSNLMVSAFVAIADELIHARSTGTADRAFLTELRSRAQRQAEMILAGARG